MTLFQHLFSVGASSDISIVTEVWLIVLSQDTAASFVAARDFPFAGRRSPRLGGYPFSPEPGSTPVLVTPRTPALDRRLRVGSPTPWTRPPGIEPAHQRLVYSLRPRRT